VPAKAIRSLDCAPARLISASLLSHVSTFPIWIRPQHMLDGINTVAATPWSPHRETIALLGMGRNSVTGNTHERSSDTRRVHSVV
jgi:hypothetical protein